MEKKLIVEQQLKVYQENFVRQGDTPAGTFHNDRFTQYLRFRRLIQPILPFLQSNSSIHDVGAGVADLHQYLLEEGIPHQYSGSEIVPEMVTTAHRKFKDVTLYNRAIEDAPDDEQHDFVVLCGTFNMPGSTPHEEWTRFVQTTIEKMFEMCRLGISFNFLTTFNTFSDPALFYLDPLQTAHFCLSKLSRFILLDHSYPLYEATITVFTKECMKNTFLEEKLAKYFKN